MRDGEGSVPQSDSTRWHGRRRTAPANRQAQKARRASARRGVVRPADARGAVPRSPRARWRRGSPGTRTTRGRRSRRRPGVTAGRGAHAERRSPRSADRRPARSERRRPLRRARWRAPWRAERPGQHHRTVWVRRGRCARHPPAPPTDRLPPRGCHPPCRRGRLAKFAAPPAGPDRRAAGGRPTRSGRQAPGPEAETAPRVTVTVTPGVRSVRGRAVAPEPCPQNGAALRAPWLPYRPHGRRRRAVWCRTAPRPSRPRRWQAVRRCPAGRGHVARGGGREPPGRGCRAARRQTGGRRPPVHSPQAFRPGRSCRVLPRRRAWPRRDRWPLLSAIAFAVRVPPWWRAAPVSGRPGRRLAGPEGHPPYGRARLKQRRAWRWRRPCPSVRVRGVRKKRERRSRPRLLGRPPPTRSRATRRRYGPVPA